MADYPKLKKEQVGRQIILESGIDLSTASAVKFMVTKPNGDAATWTAAALAAPNQTKASYLTITNDLALVGLYSLALRAEFSAGAVVLKGDTAYIDVTEDTE